MQKNTKILVISGSLLALLGLGFLVLRRKEQMPQNQQDVSTSELQRLYNQLLRSGASGRSEQEQMKKEQQQIMQQQQERQEQIAKQIQADRQKQIDSDKQAAKLKKQQEEFFKPKEQQPKETGTSYQSGYNAAYQGGYQGSYESGNQSGYQSGYQTSGYGVSGSFGYGSGGWWGDRGYGGDISDLNAYG